MGDPIRPHSCPFLGFLSILPTPILKNFNYMKSINPGRYPIFLLIKFPFECHRNHVWGPIFDPSYDHIYKSVHFVEIELGDTHGWKERKKLYRMVFSNYKTLGFWLTLCVSTRAPLGRYIYIYIAIYAYMRMFHAYLWMFPSHLLPHQPTHIHPERNPQRGGRREAPPPPFVEAARSAAPFLDGCVWAGEAADAVETSINMHETCACMHI